MLRNFGLSTWMDYDDGVVWDGFADGLSYKTRHEKAQVLYPWVVHFANSIAPIGKRIDISRFRKEPSLDRLEKGLVLVSSSGPFITADGSEYVRPCDHVLLIVQDNGAGSFIAKDSDEPLGRGAWVEYEEKVARGFLGNCHGGIYMSSQAM